LKFLVASDQIGFVLAAVITKLRSVFGYAAIAVREALRPRACSIAGGLAADLLRSRSELMTENVPLRQQLIVAARKVKRPAFRRHERALITLLAAALPRWRDALLLVKPETVLHWYREGFRLLWRWKSRSTKPPAPRVSPDLIELIRRMAAENRLWGAERIRGELLKLGIRVAKRTVQRYMRDRRNPAPPSGQSWHTFLSNPSCGLRFLQTDNVCSGRSLRSSSSTSCRPSQRSRCRPVLRSYSAYRCLEASP
jgi:hypothetical protein